MKDTSDFNLQNNLLAGMFQDLSEISSFDLSNLTSQIQHALSNEIKNSNNQMTTDECLMAMRDFSQIAIVLSRYFDLFNTERLRYEKLIEESK